MKKFTLLVCYTLFLVTVNAQEKFSDDDFIQDISSIEYEIQNPIANLARIPLEYNLSLSGENTNVLNLQPTIPVDLSKKWLLINSAMIPIINLPTTMGYENGLGNITFMSVLTLAEPSSFTWGSGPAIMLPSVNERLGFDKFSIGPSVVVIKQTKGFTYGLMVQNFFSVVGSSSTEDVNYLSSEVILSKNLKNGWYVYSNPNITANWNAESGKQWTIPLGVGAGKLITYNRYLPINVKAGVFKYVAHPTDADWLIQVQATFIINSN